METQRMLDALTDHLAVYHRSSVSKTESKARQAVVEWMGGLSYEQRRAALTVVDTSWVAIVLMMQKYLRTEGLCTFFLLPDVPVAERENRAATTKVTRKSKGKNDSNMAGGKGTRSTLCGSEATKNSLSPSSGKWSNKNCSNCTLPLPGLCFRRARGLLRRLETQQTSSNLLLNSLRLFSSGDGENKSRSCSLDSGGRVDCMTVTEDFIANMSTFVEIMDDLSHQEFLNTPHLSAASRWEETSWLKAMGYYSLPAFVANKFEFELWSAWSRAQSTKRPSRSLALKSKDTQNGGIAMLCSCYEHGNAAVKASVFGRKQGCVEWWRKLGTKERANLVQAGSAVATKFEVLKIAGEAMACRKKDTTRTRSKSISRDPGKTRLNGAFRTSLSDSEVEEHVRLGTEDVRGAAVSPYFAGLRALQELSESGILSIQESETNWVFDSTLESVHTLADCVKGRVRNVFVKVRNELVELELLGDVSHGKAPTGNGCESSEVKVSKSKKKKRKNTGTPKVEARKEEEKICSSKSKLPKEERKRQGHTDCCPVDAELQDTYGGDQVMSEAKSISGGKQLVNQKGKSAKSKGKRDEKLHQSTLIVMQSAMNAEDLAGVNVDVRSHSDGSLETSKGPCSDCDRPAASGNNSLDNCPSLEVQVKCPAILIGHGSIVKSPASNSILNLGQEEPDKLHNACISVRNAKMDKKTVSNGDNDEVPLDRFVPRMSTGTGRFATDIDCFQNISSKCATPVFFQQQTSTIQDCLVSTGDVSGCRNKLEDCMVNRTICDVPVPIVEAGKCPSVVKQDSVSDIKKSSLHCSLICFGTVDAALPELKKSVSVPILSTHSGKAAAPRLFSKEERALDTMPSNVEPVSPCLNGRMRFTTTSRQLDYSNSRHSHYQQGPHLRSGPHEWPGSPQFGYFGAYHQPPATDWLQLDVCRGWPHRMESSVRTYRNAPVLRQQNGQVESLLPRTVPARTSNVGNTDRPLLVQPSYNITPAVGYAITSKEEPRLNLRPVFTPSPFLSGYGEVESNGQGQNMDELEKDDRLAYDTDGDDYGIYKSGEFEDLDGYPISEEEGERYLEDAGDSSSSDYHQIFGGGVMYWNAADYAGLGYSRPGSMSSEDSSWARHEADLSAVLGDIVNYQPVQGPYSGKGSTGSNVPSCSPSPPSSSSIPMPFEHLSPVAPSNPRHFLPRPSVKEFPGKFGQLSNHGRTVDDQSVGARIPIKVEVIEQIRADSSAQPSLRPIVVVRDLNLTRQLSSSDALIRQEAKSPHNFQRTRRDLAGRRKRPPSPVLHCVPPAPPPPPPSPVLGIRRRKGLMGARSGSSSPRHWGLVNWPHKDESDSFEGKLMGDSREGLLTTGRRRGSTTSTPPMHPLSGALLRERLVAIPPLSLEHEHPDVSIPMKTTLLHNSNPALHLALAKLLSALHVEIEAFSLQVETENKMRKPFINMAVKKVAHSLQVLWPRSRINIFGSVATGLALPTSDVDLVVCLPPVRNLEPIKEAGILEGRNGIKETSLQHAARYLADQDWVKNDSMKTIENTPVPIIMMVAEFLPHQCETGDEDPIHTFSPNIHKEVCDEVAKAANRTGVFFSDSISCKEDKSLLTEDKKGPWGGKTARQLVHLDISFETPSHTGLRTAELVRELVGKYPALSPLALVLKQFLTDRSLDHPYTGGLSSYCLVLLITRFLQHQHHHGMPSSNQNLGRLFVNFLHFFGCFFDPRRMGIRIRGGGMYLSRDRYHDIDPLYIEDPLHPDNNVGRNCFRILQCVKAFADGYSILEKKLHEVSTSSEDIGKEGECLKLLEMILPCITTK